MVGERTQSYERTRGQIYETDELLQIEANIDDLNPQIYEHVVERLFDAGARDVTVTPTIMKKGRPAATVSVLVEPSARERIAAVLFTETSTIGLRYHPVARLKLTREIKLKWKRDWGRVRVKISGSGGDTLTVSPEYEDCKRLALEASRSRSGWLSNRRKRWRAGGFHQMTEASRCESTKSFSASRANRPGQGVPALSCG